MYLASSVDWMLDDMSVSPGSWNMENNSIIVVALWSFYKKKCVVISNYLGKLQT